MLAWLNDGGENDGVFAIAILRRAKVSSLEHYFRSDLPSYTASVMNYKLVVEIFSGVYNFGRCSKFWRIPIL